MIPEIMGSSLRSREAIQLGESDIRNFADIIEQSRPDGWCTFEQTLTDRFVEGIITEETAMLLSVNKTRMRQKLDTVKKSLGQDDATTDSLRLFHTNQHLPKVGTDVAPGVQAAPPPSPLPLDMKLKK